MGFFNFPHTRSYDTDLGWLIHEYQKHSGEIDALKKTVEDLEGTIEDTVYEQLTEWLEDGTLGEIVEEAIAEIREEQRRLAVQQLPDTMRYARSVLRPIFAGSGQVLQGMGVIDINNVRYLLVPSYYSGNVNSAIYVYREYDKALIATITGEYHHATSIGSYGNNIYICQGSGYPTVAVYNMETPANPVRLADIDVSAWGNAVFDFNYFDDDHCYFTTSLYHQASVYKMDMSNNEVSVICNIPADEYIHGMRQNLAYDPVNKIFALLTSSNFSGLHYFTTSGEMLHVMAINGALDCVICNELEGAVYTRDGILYFNNNPVNFSYEADNQGCVWKFESNANDVALRRRGWDLYVTLSPEGRDTDILNHDGTVDFGQSAAHPIALKYARDVEALSYIADDVNIRLTIPSTVTNEYAAYVLPINNIKTIEITAPDTFMIGEIRCATCEKVIFVTTAMFTNNMADYEHLLRNYGDYKVVMFTYRSNIVMTEIVAHNNNAYCASFSQSVYYKRPATATNAYVAGGLGNTVIDQVR